MGHPILTPDHPPGPALYNPNLEADSLTGAMSSKSISQYTVQHPSTSPQYDLYQNQLAAAPQNQGAQEFPLQPHHPGSNFTTSPFPGNVNNVPSQVTIPPIPSPVPATSTRPIYQPRPTTNQNYATQLSYDLVAQEVGNNAYQSPAPTFVASPVECTSYADHLHYDPAPSYPWARGRQRGQPTAPSGSIGLRLPHDSQPALPQGLHGYSIPPLPSSQPSSGPMPSGQQTYPHIPMQLHGIPAPYAPTPPGLAQPSNQCSGPHNQAQPGPHYVSPSLSAGKEKQSGLLGKMSSPQKIGVSIVGGLATAVLVQEGKEKLGKWGKKKMNSVAGVMGYAPIGPSPPVGTSQPMGATQGMH
jgi:hypothetical protein